MNYLVLAFASDDTAGAVLAIILFGMIAYFLPSILAWNKGDFWSVAAVNFFLGWTLIGWVVALAWALKSDKPTQIIVQNQISQSPPILCPSCGKYSLPTSNFCNSCGQPFARAAIAR